MSFLLAAVLPDNRMQRPGHDKVYAPGCRSRCQATGNAPRERWPVADAGRWATLRFAL
jgi:hypothetical protein